MFGTDAPGPSLRQDAYATPLPRFDRAAMAGLKATMDGTSRATEPAEIDEALAQLQKLATLGQLTSEVAHDFGNLLTVMLGYSELLLADLPPDGIGHTYLAEIHRAAERASALTSQILGYSRSGNDEPSTVDLGDVVRDLGSMLGRLFGNRVDLRIAANNGCPVGVGAKLAEQLVINLVLNARDALLQNGRRIDVTVAPTTLAGPVAVRLGSAGPGEFVQLRVRDFGCGMSEAVQSELFTPFYTTKPTGTGLGLSIVARIARRAGAAVAVQSRVGEGTTFDVYFPRAA